MSGDLVLPSRIARELDLERRIGPTTCPHAEDTRYADTGRRAIRCQVTGDHYAVAENFTAAQAFCCGDYTACPVLQATRENGGQGIEAWRAEMRQRRQDRLTRRQIEAGIRVDDRGVELDEKIARADSETGSG